MTDGDSMTINNRARLRKTGPSSPWDDHLPLTGYEPNAIELTNATELNDAGLQRLHRLPGFPSSTQSLRQTSTWMT